MANNDPVNVTVGNSGRKVHRAYLAHNGQASTVCGADRRGVGVTHTRRTDRPVDCLACSPAPVAETPAVEAPAATIAEQAAELAEARRTSTEQAGSYAAHVAELTAAGGPVDDTELADLAAALRGTPAPAAELPSLEAIEAEATARSPYVAAKLERAAIAEADEQAARERAAELETVAAAQAAAATYETDRARRRSTVADPAELELEAAARRRQLDAAIVEDMLTGDVEPYAAEPRPGRPAAGGRGRQLALIPLTPDEDGAQLDLLELAAEAEATR